MSGDEAYEEWLRDATDEEVAKEFGVGEQYQRPLIENFQEPVFDEARKHDEVDSYDIDSGLSVVQRTQIRKQLEKAFVAGYEQARHTEPGFFAPGMAWEYYSKTELVGVVLGDTDGS